MRWDGEIRGPTEQYLDTREPTPAKTQEKDGVSKQAHNSLSM